MDTWVTVLITGLVIVAVFGVMLGLPKLIRRLFPPKHPRQAGEDHDYRDVEGMNWTSGPPI